MANSSVAGTDTPKGKALDSPSQVVEVLDNQFDPVLQKKMALTSEAIDQIGMTPFHWKLFVLTGFGYAVDSVRLTPPSFCLPCAHRFSATNSS